MLTWTSNLRKPEQAARDIVAAATWMHSTYKDELWLWRGQANAAYGVEPSVHTRVMNYGGPHATEATAQRTTTHLIETARTARLDQREGVRLPDLALLAHLQHYGAATPLLDVSTDPLIALWMVAFANAEDPDSLDDVNGHLFGIRKPPRERWIGPLDARNYAEPRPSVTSSLGDHVWWYQAPDVTERLRIQRGSFLIGPLSDAAPREDTTLPLRVGDPASNWIQARMDRRGNRGNVTRSTSDVFAIVVRGSVKKHLRALLVDRSGLSVEAIYPTPWHRPFIEQFARTYNRGRDLALDVVLPAP